MGVNLDVVNAWAPDDEDVEECWVFGPDPLLDNIWQCLPQVTLHGMDEGLTLKANRGILEAVIKEAKVLLNINATEVQALTSFLLFVMMYILMYIRMYILMYIPNVH